MLISSQKVCCKWNCYIYITFHTHTHTHTRIHLKRIDRGPAQLMKKEVKQQHFTLNRYVVQDADM